MKTNLILLVDADADSLGLVLEAAARTGHGVRLAKTSRDAFAVLQKALHDLDVVIVDVDPGAHGLALLEAVSACAERPPMVVITALEETYMESIAKEHGAAACLGKPITIERLKAALGRVSKKRSSTCDRWGFLIPPPVDKGLDVRCSFTGITAKLSAVVTRPATSENRSRERFRSAHGQTVCEEASSS